MKRTLFGIAVGAFVVWAGNGLYDWWRFSTVHAQPPENWLDIQLSIPDAEPGQDPIVHATFAVLRPVIIRTNISPRNVETGESICQGRSTSTYDAPSSRRVADVPIAFLAGLEKCNWPAGRYAASITFTMTDLETNVQLKALALDREFTVVR